MLKVNVNPQKYRSYSSSGGDCSKTIPAHWLLVPLGSFAKVIDPQPDHRAPAMDANGFPYIGIRDIREDGTLDFSSARFVSENAVSKQEAAFTVNEGDILFCKVGTLGEPRHVRLEGSRFALSATLVLIKIGCNLLNKFSKYVLESDFLNAQINPILTGATRPALGIQQIRKFSIPRPPYDELVEIVKFLDKNVGLIDQAIALKNNQVSLFKERKQILIQQAVTRGLVSGVPMRDSGIEWIGEIPAHWRVLANRALFQERVEAGRDDLPLLSVSIHSGVSEEEISEEENVRGRAKIEDKSKYIRVRPGDIAFNMMRAWQGAIGAVRVEGMVSPAYTIATPRPSLDARYFEYQYRTPGFIQQMDRYSKGITDFRKRLYWDGFKQLTTLVPPIEEQRAIIDFIEQAMRKQNTAVILLERQISKLKEYKAILINCAVTGNIKVPGVADPVISNIEVT